MYMLLLRNFTGVYFKVYLKKKTVLSFGFALKHSMGLLNIGTLSK